MKKDRQNGRPIIYNNVEKQRAGTEAEEVGEGSRSFLCRFVTFNAPIASSLRKNN